jgi:hypothetical protein
MWDSKQPERSGGRPSTFVTASFCAIFSSRCTSVHFRLKPVQQANTPTGILRGHLTNELMKLRNRYVKPHNLLRRQSSHKSNTEITRKAERCAQTTAVYKFFFYWPVPHRYIGTVR